MTLHLTRSDVAATLAGAAVGTLLALGLVETLLRREVRT